jgi:hypothetical protein
VNVLRLKTKFQNPSLITVQAATAEKEAFYQAVEAAHDLCPSSDINSVGGLEWHSGEGRNLQRIDW